MLCAPGSALARWNSRECPRTGLGSGRGSRRGLDPALLLLRVVVGEGMSEG